MEKNKDIEFRVWRLGRFLGSVWNEGERERELLGLLKGSYSNFCRGPFRTSHL